MGNNHPYKWSKRINRWRFLILFFLSLAMAIATSTLFFPSTNLAQSPLMQSPLVQSPPTQPQDGPTLVQQGKAEYDAGQFTAAIQSLNTAAQLFEAQANGSALAATLTNLARAEFARGSFEAALQQWDNAAAVYGDRLQDLNGVTQSQIYQAQTLQSMGLYPRACQILTQALNLTAELCTHQRITPDVLGQVEQLSSPSAPQVLGWRMLGDLLRTMGRLNESQQVLQTLVTHLPVSSAKDSSQLSLGNTFYAFGNREQERRSPQKFAFVPWQCDVKEDGNEDVPTAAKTYYQQADETYQQVIDASVASSITQLKAQVNQARVANRLGMERLKHQVISSLKHPDSIQTLPLNRPRVYAQIQLAKSKVCRDQHLDQTPQWSQIAQILMAAYQDAQTISDQKLQSYVLGTMGGLYEYQSHRIKNNDPESTVLKNNALDLTTQALYLAEQQQANELIYQWQWQQGRILKAQGQREKAIVSYESAIQTLESIREDLLFVSSDVQFSFRDNVEPIYRELLSLLFSPTPQLSNAPTPQLSNAPTPQRLQSTLGNALYYVETLQLAELENFLQCNVESLDLGALERLSAQPNPVDVLLNRSDRILAKDPSAALIYPIVLDEAIAIILKQPHQDLRYIITPIPHKAVESTLDDLRQYLKDPSRTNEVKQLSIKVYDWIIKPLEQELDSAATFESSSVKNLVFVLDGSLRDVPMSLLYDEGRDRYLLERYAIGISSGLQLLPIDSQIDSSRSFNALVAGLSQERVFDGRQFSALRNVPKELDAIQQAVPSQQLLNETFIRTTLQTTLQKTPFSVVHMATHGKFSSDPEDTFIVLADGPLKAQDFNQLLRIDNPELSRSIDLLVLSACETAAGDKRATLGLAGMALRSGAESTLATLWQVNDASTAEVMVAFYQQLSQHSTLTKAEALRLAQLSLWNNTQQDWSIPFFWAPYVLVGNWI